jgi:branched-subunit amino acid transport protein
MNHLLATYIDLIQSVGFIFLMTLVVFITRKLFLDNINDNFIEAVRVKVDE